MGFSSVWLQKQTASGNVFCFDVQLPTFFAHGNVWLASAFKPFFAEREHVDEAEDVGAQNNYNLAPNHRN